MTHTDRTDFLGVGFDRLSFEAVIRRLARVEAGSAYQYVLTPNVDHIVFLRKRPDLAAIYRKATYCLCDSRVLKRLAWLGGLRLSLVPGSDLTRSVFNSIVQPGDCIAVVGGTSQLIDTLRAKFQDVTILHHLPPLGLRTNAAARRAAAAFVADSRARFNFLAVGSPQQEMIAGEVLGFPHATGTAFCIGASLEFLTGEQKRAPRILQSMGLEWAHRLASNPSRLWRRYLVDGLTIFPMFLRSRHARFLRWSIGSATLLLAAAAILLPRSQPDRPRDGTKHSAGAASQPTTTGSAPKIPIDLPPPDLFRPLTTEQAIEVNAQRPLVPRPDKPAAGLFLKTGMPGRVNALACLTQAIYYEAAGEGIDGGRAVAQVVLNRVRHPAYPASVCGVVYQGSDRRTGCQFSFTCDGSLLRTPNFAIWERSREIAEAALAGHVFAPVGHATYYHADYVVPYWAASLDKTVQIGRHIFYRLRNSLGAIEMFRQGYNGIETIPLALPPIAFDSMLSVPPVPPTSSLIADDPTAATIPQPLNVESEPAAMARRPIADSTSGKMIADGEKSPPAARRPKSLTGCPGAGTDEKQLRPLAPYNASGLSEPVAC